MIDEGIAYNSTTGRWIILATVLGSGIAFLDSTVVNVALPAIGSDFNTGFSSLQWTISAYMLTLGALLLVGGALGDLYGRRLVFVIGLTAFTLASLLCGVAPTVGVLIAARALQGVGAALLVPGSLAIISGSFRDEDKGQAIGAWSGLSGVTTAIGPFVGGWLVDSVSWRLVFLINLPLAALAIAISLKHVPESRDEAAARTPDVAGGIAAAMGLGGIVFALIEGPARGWDQPLVRAAGAAGIIALIAFLVLEARRRHPMMPFSIFRSRQFSAANATTLVVYAALSASVFLLVIQLQKMLGYSALESGAALIPVTLLLLVLSPTAGRLSQRWGPRGPMTAGPLVAGVAFLALMDTSPGSNYFSDLLPGILLFGLGLAATVAPLTTAVLTAIEGAHAGIASGINNAVARVAGLLAVVLVPLAAGISGVDEVGGEAFSAGFRRSMLINAGLCGIGALISFVWIRKPPGALATTVPPAPDNPAETVV
ncbi:MAG: MFS transporter [Actinomycetota bacterium]|nr:MFS transporter [Actinomycetota bacterium]